MPDANAVLADFDSEEATLGAMMISVDAIESAAGLLEAADFVSPRNTIIYSTIVNLYRNGLPVDPLTVASDLDRQGELHNVGGKTDLLRIQSVTPASANVPAYAARIVELSDRRRLRTAGAELNHRATDFAYDVDQIRDTARADLDTLTRPGESVTHAHFADWAPGVTMGYDWIVPDVLEARDRVILVAGEGSGKSWLLRQWALMAACGVHWFREERTPPKRALVIDVENSARQIVRNTRHVFDFARSKYAGWDNDNFVIVPVGASLDITARADRLLVERYLSGHRPDVLVIGPLYKLMRMVRRDSSYEEQADAVINVLDGWRERYGVALLIEHHAAKGSGGHRSMDPLGSSMFLRWPEFVVTLEQDETNRARWNVGHARGQREVRSWPDALERSRHGWSWTAVDQQDF